MLGQEIQALGSKLVAYFPKETKVVLVLIYVFPLVVYGYLEAALLFLFPRWLIKPQKSISDQTVLITGAGSGLGRQTAIEFSKLCAHVVLLDLNKTSLSDTKKLLDSRTEVSLYQCDVSDREKVYEVARLIGTEVGKVDILINNAGVVTGKRILDLPDDMIRKTMDVNTMSHFWMCKAFLPDMMTSNKGHIVSVASAAGICGFARLTDYCASKFAAVGLMESLTLELEAQGLQGVKLTTVCPSLISTGLFEGTRPPLTVTLTSEYVAQEIVTAVLEEKELVLLPKWTYLIVLLKWTMPRCAVRQFYKKSGFLNSWTASRAGQRTITTTRTTEQQLERRDTHRRLCQII